MKKYLTSVAVLGLFACGGQANDETSLDIGGETIVGVDENGGTILTLDTAFPGAPVTPILSAEDADGISPNYVDRLTWEGEKIDFIEVYADLDVQGQSAKPSIMVYRTGPIAHRDIVDLMHESAPAALSPAELWMGITGREDLPPALALDHFNFTAFQGRTPEFLRVDANEVVTEKNATTDPVIYAAIPGHGWQRKRETPRTTMGDQVSRYSCSEVETTDTLPLLKTGVPTQASACSNSYNEGGWVRSAMYNDSQLGMDPLIGQACYGPSTDGAWTCYAPGMLGTREYAIFDWVTSEKQQKRMTMAAVSQRNYGFIDSFWKVLWAVGKNVPGG